MASVGVDAYRFGPFELRPRDYLLIRDGTAVHVNPKAFDALRMMVEQRGHVVDKKTLVAALWPDTIVEEANLSVQMAAVRKALRTCEQSAQYIETVPKRGYRFVADVTVVLSPVVAGGDNLTPAAADDRAIAVLPLTILRGESRSDFLAFSLPDAVAASLAEQSDIPVRSPLAAARYAGPGTDLAALASALHVSYAVIGTLTDIGGRVAVHLQLLEVPSGTVLWSESRVASLDEIFELQDTAAAGIARSLRASVDPLLRVVAADPPRPKNAGAYAFYLRANQLAYEASQWTQARALYRACLDLDPDYAPAWARLGRCERLIGKFSSSAADASIGFARAEQAFHRALALNPDLSIAHSLHAQLVVDLGRADEAMDLLLDRAIQRPAEPELYVGLVHALRYCGLLQASLAAHVRARRLDPTAPTSVHHTWWMLGEYEHALSETLGDIGYMQGLALASLGRERDAIAALRWRERETTEGWIRPYLASLRRLLEGDRDKSLAAAKAATARVHDAEAIFYLARTFVRLGDHERGIDELRRVVERGFWCYDTFIRDPWLAPIRARADVHRLLEETREHVLQASAKFQNAQGPQLLDY